MATRPTASCSASTSAARTGWPRPASALDRSTSCSRSSAASTTRSPARRRRRARRVRPGRERHPARARGQRPVALAELIRGSVINRVVRRSGPIDVHVISSAAPAGGGHRVASTAWSAAGFPTRIAGFGLALVGLPLLTIALSAACVDASASRPTCCSSLTLVLAIGAVGGIWPAIASGGFLAPPQLVLHRRSTPGRSPSRRTSLALVVFVAVAIAVSVLVDRQRGRGRRRLAAEVRPRRSRGWPDRWRPRRTPADVGAAGHGDVRARGRRGADPDRRPRVGGRSRERRGPIRRPPAATSRSISRTTGCWSCAAATFRRRPAPVLAAFAAQLTAAVRPGVGTRRGRSRAGLPRPTTCGRHPAGGLPRPADAAGIDQGGRELAPPARRLVDRGRARRVPGHDRGGDRPSHRPGRQPPRHEPHPERHAPAHRRAGSGSTRSCRGARQPPGPRTRRRGRRPRGPAAGRRRRCAARAGRRQPGRERPVVQPPWAPRSVSSDRRSEVASNCGWSTGVPASRPRITSGSSSRSSGSATARASTASVSVWRWRVGSSRRWGASSRRDDTPGGGTTMVVAFPLAAPTDASTGAVAGPSAGVGR